MRQRSGIGRKSDVGVPRGAGELPVYPLTRRSTGSAGGEYGSTGRDAGAASAGFDAGPRPGIRRGICATAADANDNATSTTNPLPREEIFFKPMRFLFLKARILQISRNGRTVRGNPPTGSLHSLSMPIADIANYTATD